MPTGVFNRGSSAVAFLYFAIDAPLRSYDTFTGAQELAVFSVVAASRPLQYDKVLEFCGSRQVSWRARCPRGLPHGE